MSLIQLLFKLCGLKIYVIKYNKEKKFVSQLGVVSES